MGIKRLIEGHLEFQKDSYPLHEKEFVKLIEEGQKPNALFISCSDSRVVPELITKCDPGTLFHQRQVGNFIPPYSEEPCGLHTSTIAAIEFAIHELKVEDIIICGHSNCGACAALYQNLDDSPELKYLKTWIQQSPKLMKFATLQKDSNLDPQTLSEITERVSLVCQVENLLTYPIVSQKVKDKEIFLHAWYYDIAKGEIDFFDTENLNFSNLTDIFKKHI